MKQTGETRGTGASPGRPLDHGEQLRTFWPEFRGRIQERWSRLTDDWLDEVDGRRDRLAARLRDAYGVSEGEANRQVDDFVETHWGALSARNMSPGSASARSSGEHPPGRGNKRIRERDIGDVGIGDSDVGTGTIEPGGRKI